MKPRLILKSVNLLLAACDKKDGCGAEFEFSAEKLSSKNSESESEELVPRTFEVLSVVSLREAAIAAAS